MNKTKFQSLCIKELTNNISELEKRQLFDLLKSSEQYKAEFNKIKETWKLSEAKKLKYEISEEEIWSGIERSMSGEREQSSKRSFAEYFEKYFIPIRKPAYSFGAALVVIIFSLMLVKNFDSEMILKTIETKNNERIEVLLPDGSIVNLNSSSKIEYYEDFEDDKREVRLEGEGFFSVKKDGRPFSIKTANAVTKVLGTRFNVWARSKETRVIVKEGKVSLAESITNNEVILIKDQLSKVIESNKPIEPVKVDSEYLLGWLDGRIVFNNTPFLEISEELERNYNIEIEIADEEIRKYNLTGTFEDEKIDTVLTKICLALNLKYSETKNGYKVTK